MPPRCTASGLQGTQLSHGPSPRRAPGASLLAVNPSRSLGPTLPLGAPSLPMAAALSGAHSPKLGSPLQSRKGLERLAGRVGEIGELARWLSSDEAKAL